MRFTLEHLPDYLRAELVERQTALETREFLRAFTAAWLEHRYTRALIIVRESRPIFRVEEYRFSRHLKALASVPQARVALVSGDGAVRASHEYLEQLGRQKNVDLRSFRQESEAVRWLTAPLRERS